MKVSVCGVITNTVLFSLLFSAVGVGCDVVTSVGAADVDGVVTVLSVVASVRGAAVSVVVVVLGIDAGVV
jgi:hypothetical protein